MQQYLLSCQLLFPFIQLQSLIQCRGCLLLQTYSGHSDDGRLLPRELLPDSNLLPALSSLLVLDLLEASVGKCFSFQFLLLPDYSGQSKV